MEKNINDVLDDLFGNVPPPVSKQPHRPSSQQGSESSTQPNKNISVRYDAVTGEPMEAIDIPDGNGGFVQVDYCKSTGGWFLDKEELSALRSIPGIVQIIQTYSSN